MMRSTAGGPSAAGLPAEGWRELRTAVAHDSPLLGAPTPDGRWALARIRSTGSGCSFEPMQSVDRYPSKLERGAGLRLRWPAAARDAGVRRLFVDAVNESDRRWTPTAVDHFHAVGRLARIDALPRDWYFAWAAPPQPSFILDPGEYARLPVHLPATEILEHGAGEVFVYARLVALGLSTMEPLTLAITDADLIELERQRAARPAPPPPDSER